MSDEQIPKNATAVGQWQVDKDMSKVPKKVIINAKISIPESDRPPDIVLPRVGLSGAVEALATITRKELLSLFSRAPEFGDLKNLIDQLSIDSSASEKIVDLFARRRFNSTDQHITLLSSLDLSSMTPLQQIDIHYVLSGIYRHKREFSLAIVQIDCAIELSRQVKIAPENIIAQMTMRGLCLAQSGHPETNDYHRTIVNYASEQGLQQHLASAYKNWSSYLWFQGKYKDALLLLEREVEIRKNQEINTYIRSLYWLALRQESVDRVKAIATCQEAIRLVEIRNQDLTDIVRAEAHYETACMMRRLTDNHELVAKHARIAYELFEQWLGYEVRSAWCAGLLSTVHKELGNVSEAIHYSEQRQSRVKEFGGAKETFALIAETILRGETNADDLKNLEALVIATADDLITVRWYTLLALHKLQRNYPLETISIGKHALRLIEEKDFRHKYNAVEFSHLYRTLAEGFLAVRNVRQYLECLKKAIEIVPSNTNTRWVLCHNSFLFGELDIAHEQALFLRDHAPSIGSYRVHARCELAMGNIDTALEIIEQARARHPSHQDITAEYRELSDIKLGLLDISHSKFFSKLPAKSALNTTPPPPSGMPEYENLKDFRKAIIDTIVIFIRGIQRTRPSYIAAYNRASSQVSLEESHFRDDCERICEQKWRDVGAEARHGSGRTDLIIHANAPNPDAVIVEFKIWARNDYKDVVTQLIGYLTDFQSVGVVFMVNINQEPISDKYIQNVILENQTYVGGSFRDRPVINNRMDHYYSRHRSQMGKEMEVFHFILNIWDGAIKRTRSSKTPKKK